MTFDLVETLRQLVAIPSVNPMGLPVEGPEYFESRLTDYLEKLLRSMGLPCWRQPVAPGRDNLIARLDGDTPPDRGGSLILFEAHQDTVPVEGMTIDPFRLSVRDGRLYGRGACDIKGGMTAMLAALARLAQERPRDMPTIALAATVNEEHGFTGATALARLWQDLPGGIIPRRPDAAVVAEPTELDVVVAHKGTVRWRCHATGRAAHSAQPELGENAIYKMARGLSDIERYAREVVPSQGTHPLCGNPTLSVGVIRGGISVNTVPDRCTIEIDRRFLPGDDPEAAWRHAVQYLSRDAEAEALEHEPPFLQSKALADESNGALAERLATIAGRVAGCGRRIGVSFGTDAACYAATGVPAVVFGPGSIRQAHTRDEWVALDQLEQAAEILYDFGRAGLSPPT
jgi:acetylornithine deacetylase/succinyl-diaminopimelate desuccinylase-like protein